MSVTLIKIKHLITTLLLLNLLLIHTSVNATDATRSLAIKAGAIINTLTGNVLQNQLIIVTGNKIVSVEKFSEGNIPTLAQYIDLSNATLLPGLIDTHVHLTMDHDSFGYSSLAISNARATINGVVNARKTLMAGFTTVRNLGAAGFSDIALRDAINEGKVPGPRIIASGPSIGITGGHCDMNLLPVKFNYKNEGVADGPWAVRAKVRENIKYGADVIKLCATGGVFSKGTKLGAQQYTLEEMKAIVDEAHMAGLKVAAHAHGLDGIRTAIVANVDSIEHASYIDAKTVKLAIKRGTYLGMDIYDSDYILAYGQANGALPESLAKERVVGSIQRGNFTQAVKMGANIAYSTDAAVYPHGNNAKQLAYMVKYGMTAMQALQAATINSARLLGLEDEIGSISVGKQADIIGVYGNPIDNVSILERVAFVIKQGVVVKE